MRVIAIMGAALLVAAAAAATTQATTRASGMTQKAAEAPEPAGVAKKGGLVEQVSCPSANSCAAFGKWMYSEQAGRWKAVKAPVLAHTGGTNLRSLACPSAGRCESVGIAGEQHVLRLTEAGRQWHPAGFSLPGNAALPKGAAPASKSHTFLNSISCASARACTAGGYYSDRAGRIQGLLLNVRLR